MAKTAHLIGICGAGMSAVARLLQQAGYTVTGSDEGAYPPVSTYLETLGIAPMIGHRAANLPADPDLVVIGKHAKLVPETNEEVAAALDKHQKAVRSFPEVLAALTEERDRTVIAGSYGKSTMTTLIASCLQQATKAPGWFIGAIPRGLGVSSETGADGPFLFEGDEYPSANWDDRSKFLHYRPQTVILTAATHDHINVFPTLTAYHQPFHDLLMDLADRGGHLVACTDERHAKNFFHAFPGRKTSYGLEGPCDVTASNIVLGDPSESRPTRFDLVIERDILPGFEIAELGRHAVQNACGAAAYLLCEGLLTPDAFRNGLAGFEGLARRLDRKAEASRLLVYEGFGSSREKARAAIDAITAHFPQRRLVVLFEPHAFSWRNRAAAGQYAQAFEGAGTVHVAAPPGHGADTHDQLTQAEITALAATHHRDVRPLAEGALSAVLDDLDPDRDIVLVLSSGSFGGRLEAFLAETQARFPA